MNALDRICEHCDFFSRGYCLTRKELVAKDDTCASWQAKAQGRGRGSAKPKRRRLRAEIPAQLWQDLKNSVQ